MKLILTLESAVMALVSSLMTNSVTEIAVAGFSELAKESRASPKPKLPVKPITPVITTLRLVTLTLKNKTLPISNLQTHRS
ncbi:hypothetical protein D3C84_1174240 [compost metagenome]